MTWIELDDGILDHPKFIRAIKQGGADTVFLWLGMRAHCSQHLTDGKIAEDLIDDVRGPKNPRDRARALEILIAVRLLDRLEDGVQMHNYLKWSSSRDDVLARREKARKRKAKSRRDGDSDDERDGDGTDDDVTLESHFPSSSSSSSSSSKEDQIRVVFECWQGVHGHPNARLDAKRKARIRARLKDKFTPEQLCEAIRNAKQDRFLMGENDRKTVFDDLESLLKDAAKVERLLRISAGSKQDGAANGYDGLPGIA